MGYKEDIMISLTNELKKSEVLTYNLKSLQNSIDRLATAIEKQNTLLEYQLKDQIDSNKNVRIR